MMEANRPQAEASVTKNGGSKLDPKAIREQLDRIPHLSFRIQVLVLQ